LLFYSKRPSTGYCGYVIEVAVALECIWSWNPGIMEIWPLTSGLLY